jgi:hypothetical protein
VEVAFLEGDSVAQTVAVDRAEREVVVNPAACSVTFHLFQLDPTTLGAREPTERLPKKLSGKVLPDQPMLFVVHRCMFLSH